MESGANDPNVEFADNALAFLESQSGQCQAELIAIAAGLYHDPWIDGETKLMVPVAHDVAVTLYGRAYIGERYWMYYDYDAEAQPPLLIISDCGLIDPPN